MVEDLFSDFAFVLATQVRFKLAFSQPSPDDVGVSLLLAHFLEQFHYQGVFPIDDKVFLNVLRQLGYLQIFINVYLRPIQLLFPQQMLSEPWKQTAMFRLDQVTRILQRIGNVIAQMLVFTKPGLIRHHIPRYFFLF